ncbi:hypothetical protein EDD22DRAFT_849710 [Suillus occidentalis]|nr:hypothetical protein EDD22DRAFT_849710 [Suillus occidentalis]
MTKRTPTPLAGAMNTPRGGRELKGVLGGLLPIVNDIMFCAIQREYSTQKFWHFKRDLKGHLSGFVVYFLLAVTLPIPIHNAVECVKIMFLGVPNIVSMGIGHYGCGSFAFRG